MTSELHKTLTRALGRAGRPSSDYDLNAGTDLPEGRRLRPAGVLVPIVDLPGGAGLWLTKRAPTLKHHPGQIAFPGGKVDPDDDGVLGAALREAHEEIGLDCKDTQVLGTLPPHETVTGFQVTPVVALVSPGFRPVPEVGEVAEVFQVPLAHVLNPASYRIESRRWRGVRRHYFTAPWGPYYIWGATARILRALADRMVDDDTH